MSEPNLSEVIVDLPFATFRLSDKDESDQINRLARMTENLFKGMLSPGNNHGNLLLATVRSYLGAH